MASSNESDKLPPPQAVGGAALSSVPGVGGGPHANSGSQNRQQPTNLTPNTQTPPSTTVTGNPALPSTSTDGRTKTVGLIAEVAAFRTGSATFSGILDTLVASVQREREDLEREREALKDERAQFEAENARVVNVLSDREQVILNVGGYRFTTSVTTLRNAPSPSLFNAMFSGRHALRSDAADGAIFIDRDGKHFGDVLNFLRDGQLAYPPDGTDFKYLLELRAEAEYYGLTGLVSIVDRYPYNVTAIKRAAALNVEDSWMYEDGQDEVVFTVDRPCHLLGVGFCGTEGGLTVELDVYEVDPEDFSSEVQTLAQAAHSFTKADGSLLKLSLAEPACLLPGRTYMLSALIKGNESFCCEECLDTVIAGGIRVQFQCWESPNGTNETRGQFPEIYLRACP